MNFDTKMSQDQFVSGFIGQRLPASQILPQNGFFYPQDSTIPPISNSLPGPGIFLNNGNVQFMVQHYSPSNISPVSPLSDHNNQPRVCVIGCL